MWFSQQAGPKGLSTMYWQHVTMTETFQPPGRVTVSMSTTLIYLVEAAVGSKGLCKRGLWGQVDPKAHNKQTWRQATTRVHIARALCMLFT